MKRVTRFLMAKLRRSDMATIFTQLEYFVEIEAAYFRNPTT
jgi:hypothetical protein